MHYIVIDFAKFVMILSLFFKSFPLLYLFYIFSELHESVEIRYTTRRYYRRHRKHFYLSKIQNFNSKLGFFQ